MDLPSRFPVQIRKMCGEDLERVKEIDQMSFTLPWPPQSFRFELKNNPVARLWVAEAQQETQQQICGILVVWLVIDEAHIGTIAVHPDFRQRGIATRLLKHGLRSLQMEGAKMVYLEVRRSNTPAQVLYERFGFTLRAVRTGYYQDNGEDALILSLEHLETRDFT